MANKCPKCGFEYGEFDIYCSRCGFKLNIKTELEEATNNIMQNFFNSNASRDEIENKINLEYYKTKNENNSIFEIFTILFIVSLILTLLLVVIFNKQSKTKTYLEYKNLITKPSLIPVLANTNDLDEFRGSLARNEHFLKLYLNFSNDGIAKKEQIFSSYLAEINKLQYFTNEDLTIANHEECSAIENSNQAKKCLNIYNKNLRNTGAKAYLFDKTIYFYPNKKYISKNFSKYFTHDTKKYLKVQAKYPNPTSYDNILQLKPKELCDKIIDFEYVFNNISNTLLKDNLEEEMYNDIKSLMFGRDVFATTTQEMKKEYKVAYYTHIRNNKKSAFVPLFISYLDKQKGYSEDNFTKDYPYKIYKNSFDDNVENIMFKDIFVQLRKNIAANVEASDFAYIYNLVDGKWRKFESSSQLTSHDYVVSNPDSDNNITFYTSTYSPFQEMNIQKYSKLFLNLGGIYIFNKDKLSISKINFNGKTFNTKTLNFSDIVSIFPWVEVVNVDSTAGYHIYIEKPNKLGKYILTSRYLQGFNNYELTLLQGDSVQILGLDNMFAVDTNNEIIISFHEKSIDPNETSEQNPTYKIHIKTIGHQAPKQEAKASEFIDDNSGDDSSDEIEETHTPTIKPKINTSQSDALILPPSQNLEPPKDDD